MRYFSFAESLTKKQGIYTLYRVLGINQERDRTYDKSRFQPNA